MNNGNSKKITQSLLLFSIKSCIAGTAYAPQHSHTEKNPALFRGHVLILKDVPLHSPDADREIDLETRVIK